LACHPDISRVSEVLDGLEGNAYNVGRILVYGACEQDLPIHTLIADAYKDWRDNFLRKSYSGICDKRARIH